MGRDHIKRSTDIFYLQKRKYYNKTQQHLSGTPSMLSQGIIWHFEKYDSLLSCPELDEKIDISLISLHSV